MDASKTSSISKADTDEEIGTFWNTHDFTDFDTDAPDVEFEVVSTVPIEVNLLGAIERQAGQEGMSVEALINLWLRQKLDEKTVA